MNGLAKTLRTILQRTALYSRWERSRQNKEYQDWLTIGQPVPPPHRAKQLSIIDLAHKHSMNVFIETGTYLGDMVEAMKGIFDQIHSIELSAALYRLALKRFRGYPGIHLYQGDSGTVLGEILKELHVPALFWLDGHYSSGATSKGPLETPIEQELKHILNHPLRAKHVIVIDDARLFTGRNDYPTIESVHTAATAAGYNFFEIESDSIRILNRC